MFDFLLKNNLSTKELGDLVAFVIGSSFERILVLSDQSFFNMQDIDFSKFDCLCVFSSVSGDASILLQILRCDIEAETLKEKFISACSQFKIESYIPNDLFDEWVHVMKDGSLGKVEQLDTEVEGNYVFK